MDMHRLIDTKRDEIAALCRRYGVRRLEVFGSAARADEFDLARSDVDFLVEFNRPLPVLSQFLAFQDELGGLLEREVDLVERSVVERSRNYIRRRHILADARPVYVA